MITVYEDTVLRYFFSARGLICLRAINNQNNHRTSWHGQRKYPFHRSLFMTSLARRNNHNFANTSGLTASYTINAAKHSLASSIPPARQSRRSPSFNSCRWAVLEMHNSASHQSPDGHVYPKRSINLPVSEETSLSELCALVHDNVTAFLESPAPSELLQHVQRQTSISLAVLKEALDNYKLEEVALSYNGGKDCLVLLILWLVTLHRHFGHSRSAAISSVANSTRHQDTFPTSIKSVYIRPQHPFAEVEEFVHHSAQQYHLTLTTLTKSMKAAFTEYLDENSQVKAIFVGTRRTDPHGSDLSHFSKTDGGWPEFMRCHPVIDWHYREIWAFIRYFDVPYCRLYDLGYTSLGGTDDTNPNPRLIITTAEEANDGCASYRPAYELLEDDEERLGRP